MGGATTGLAIDDVLVQAPPIEGGGALVRALVIDFEEEGEPLHVAVVHAAPGGKGGVAVGGDAALKVQQSPHAAL